MNNSSPQRNISDVPWLLYAGLIAALALHVFMRVLAPSPSASLTHYASPPSSQILNVASFGEQAVMSRLMMLWIQTFDSQAGVEIAYSDLDYAKLEQWMQRSSDLDSRNPYPLFAATQVYYKGQDPQRIKLLLTYTRQQYLKNPSLHWRWMAAAVLIAKHKLHDQAFALSLAKDITRLSDANVPSWARQMELLIYEDMGEFESMQYLIGAQLASGVITDAQELNFLNSKLQDIGKAGQ